MPHIQQLSPHVADLIAAGEVVERPASVVKELLENAIDAGAQSVTVEMKNGGMTYLRVSDDGCGIAPSELPTAFLRHATSKLRTAEDLAAIGTLGFRGEALAAISSVSRLDIFSRERGALSGAKLHLEGGVPGTVEDAGCPEGTSIIVRDLFYNTPARLKFMKQDRAEATAIAGLAAHIALSHPDISFRLIKDGREELHTPGDGKPLSAVYAALGRDFALALVEVHGRDGQLAVVLAVGAVADDVVVAAGEIGVALVVRQLAEHAVECGLGTVEQRRHRLRDACNGGQRLHQRHDRLGGTRDPAHLPSARRTEHPASAAVLDAAGRKLSHAGRRSGAVPHDERNSARHPHGPRRRAAVPLFNCEGRRAGCSLRYLTLCFPMARRTY